MNFNELDLPGLNNSVAGNTVASGTGSGSLLDLINVNGCIGSDCCGTNTEWDQGNSLCKSLPKLSGFTTMNLAYINGDLSNMKVSANSPYEFSDYVPIK